MTQREDLALHARRVYEDVIADPVRSARAADDLVRRARGSAHPEALVLALRAAAWARRARLLDGEAKDLLDEAARIARRHRLDHALADVLMTRAAVNQELGRIPAARRDLDHAVPLVAPDRTSDLAFQRAILHHNVGRLTDAARTYRSLLADARTPDRIRVIASNNLAMIDGQRGRHRDAQRLLDRIAPVAAGIGPALVAMIVETRAWVTVQSGQLSEGLRLFEESARAHERAGLPLGEHYVEYADALMDLRLLPEASTAARMAVEVFRSNGVPLMGAEAELRVAQLALLLDDTDGAQQASARAAAEFDRQRRPVWRARAALVQIEARLRAGRVTEADLRASQRICRTLTDAGTWHAAVRAHLTAGRAAADLRRDRTAVRALRRAAELARSQPVLVRLAGHVASALAARLRRHGGDALAHCRRGLADLARHRTALPSAELRALASGHGVELGQIGLEVVVRERAPRSVLDWMERTRAAALLTVEPPADGELEEELAELRAAYDGADTPVTSTNRAAAGTPVTRRAALESRIRRRTWQGRGGAERPAAKIGMGPLRELLGDRVLVEYGRLGGQLMAVVVEPRRSRVVPLGDTEAVTTHVRALRFALRRLTQDRPAEALAAARLSADHRITRLRELTLAPVRVPRDAELVIVPPATLQSIPWSALHDGPVSLAPSALFWARTATATAAGRAGPVVLVEGPALTGAPDEIHRLRGLYPDATTVTPPESTAVEVMRLLDGAGLVHLACHGWLRSDNPLFSSLILSGGPLTAQELVSHGTAPHRMVFASCQSGADVAYAGDEVLGFVSALLARGTAGVVASAAPVPDVAAVELMHALHRCLIAGRTMAHALFEARAGLDRADPASFVNWCTFSAHGAA
ncbi:CHAT domain-containing protein [Virgisporangium ochraceum]|uniref:CHAT domain-containing protein n=1 Tax=Virgisporangium ochraceum TaxID=65505 RepID=UPI001941A087|nr:CHAT domain-containing protein [Virgisporangium ochraceum]